MTEMMTIPIGYVAIPIYEYQYLLSLKPRDDEKVKPIEENVQTSPAIVKTNAENATKKVGRGRGVKPEQVEEMNRLRQSGASIERISETMGIRESTIRKHLAAYAKQHPNAAMKYANRMTMAGMVQ